MVGSVELTSVSQKSVSIKQLQGYSVANRMLTAYSIFYPISNDNVQNNYGVTIYLCVYLCTWSCTCVSAYMCVDRRSALGVFLGSSLC